MKFFRKALLGLIIYANRNAKLNSLSGRAYSAAFASAGLANLAIVAVFIMGSIRIGDAGIWYFYTPVVFAIQGGAWFAAFRVLRRNWYGLVSLGWFIAAIALGVTAFSPSYVAVCSVSLFLLLALPGWLLLRDPARADRA